MSQHEIFYQLREKKARLKKQKLYFLTYNIAIYSASRRKPAPALREPQGPGPAVEILLLF